MKLLFNDRNLAQPAAITVTDDTIVPSSSIYRVDQNENAGSADVQIAGPYEGQHDTTIDVKIIDGDGDSSQTSQPVLVGVGTGTIDGVSVTGLSAQAIAITLSDLGTPTQTAQAPFQGQILQAATPGPNGNLLSIAVDPAGLDISSTPIGTLHAAISAGTSVYSGPQYDGFGAVALNADGTIPDGTNGTTAAPRVRIGHDPTVFRLAKKFNFTTNAFDFYFSPTPVRDIEANSPVYSVDGSWAFAILNNGVVAETYTGVVTEFDALQSIGAGSSLVVLSAPPLNDKTPNGQGIVDLSVWTRPYILGIVATGTQFVQQADFAVTLDDTAPTAALAFSCVDDSITGAEIWEVLDGVNVGLPNAITGVPYIGGPYAALIPQQLPGAGGAGGNIAMDFTPQPRAEGSPTPVPCLEQGLLGSAATSGQVFTFVWTKRPAAACDCTTGELIRSGPNADCLGLEPEGGGVSSAEASIVIRQQQLAAAVQTYVHSNTSPPYTAALVDVPWIEDTATIFGTGLVGLDGAPALVLDAWEATHDYETDEQARPVVRNGYRFGVMEPGGTSGSSEPTWPTTVGDTVSDGDAIWTNLGMEPFPLWDVYFAAWKTEMEALLGVGAPIIARPWSPNADITVFGNPALGQCFAVPSARNGWTYQATAVAQPSHTSASEPMWPTTYGASVSEGVAIPPNSTPNPITWTAINNYWNATSTVVADKIINPGTGTLWKATVGGTTGGTEPDFTAAGPITDGGVTWTALSTSDLPQLANQNRDVYFERFRTQMTEVQATAGIGPTFKGASTNGDGCWQDDPSALYYFKSQDGLLPMFAGRDYMSSKLTLDEDGKPFAQSTKQFYVAIRWGCQSALAVGDTLVLTLEGVAGGPKTYQQGDTQTIAIVHNDPLQFGGGQDGSDFHTWTVSGDDTFAPYRQLLATPPDRIGSHAYIEGAKYKPADSNGHWYLCTVAGTTAASPPTFQTNGSTFTDGTATFMDAGLIDGYSNNGLTFFIHEGGIAYALGDAWTLNIEGGHFEWRRDGGVWSGATVIGTTDLGDGLSLTFAGGIAPSYVANDAWSFRALAINGPDQLKAPTDGRFSWVGSTTITLAQSGTADGVMIADHTIPNTATIVLQGSNDNFATFVVNETIAWVEGSIFHDFAATAATKWRLAITMGDDEPGSIFWLWLAAAPEMLIWNGNRELGTLTKNYRLPDGAGTRAGIGYEVIYERLSKASFQAFMASLNDACKNWSGRFGVVPNDLEDEAGIVEMNAASLPVKDVKGFQPRVITTPEGQRRHGFTLTADALQ